VAKLSVTRTASGDNEEDERWQGQEGLAAALPSCAEEEEWAEEEEPLPGPSAMDLLAASSDDEEHSRRSREYRNARTKALGLERSQRERASKASENQAEGEERAHSKSSRGDGGGCLAFSCVGDDINNEEALPNVQLARSS